MRWITRERPKIDRIACPWLSARFIDPQAEFYPAAICYGLQLREMQHPTTTFRT
ncbi:MULTISPECIES: chromate resistance protein ChrB domain-containing protein [unclassified Pseudomonas]